MQSDAAKMSPKAAKDAPPPLRTRVDGNAFQSGVQNWGENTPEAALKPALAANHPAEEPGLCLQP